jgi:uncharacterized protein
MPEREGFIPGVPCWIDSGRQKADPAVEFYGKLFGWEFTDIAPPEVPGQYLVARRDGKMGAAIGVAESNPAKPTWNTYIQVDDADAAAKKVVEAGGAVITEPFDAGEAGRMGVFADTAGAEFMVWQPGVLKGAELVNSPGSWNSSDLQHHRRRGLHGVLPGGLRVGDRHVAVRRLPLLVVPAAGLRRLSGAVRA